MLYTSWLRQILCTQEKACLSPGIDLHSKRAEASTSYNTKAIFNSRWQCDPKKDVHTSDDSSRFL